MQNLGDMRMSFLFKYNFHVEATNYICGTYYLCAFNMTCTYIIPILWDEIIFFIFKFIDVSSLC